MEKKDPLNKGAIYLFETEAGRGLFPGSWGLFSSVAPSNRSKGKLDSIDQFLSERKAPVFRETSISAKSIPFEKSKEQSTQTLLWPEVSEIYIYIFFCAMWNVRLFFEPVEVTSKKSRTITYPSTTLILSNFFEAKFSSEIGWRNRFLYVYFLRSLQFKATRLPRQGFA